MYKVKVETYSGEAREISLPSKNAVAQFVNEYPNNLPKGVSVKVSCDILGVSGTLRGNL